ncbi:hypothetical protein V5N11_019213 [Cardamine amara subsp. amara]|uniref:DUF4283 domain-containing protein n=1 Tax=Cardamine amara subsp. amara TaxID=228776 RepID=A0ABD1C6H9_CARAN
MEGNAFLFRIPNALTRTRVLAQKLWQIEGQTMFVAKWQPGPTQKKPELTSAPIWLELRNVPLQYFNSDGLEYIAGQVGHPVDLHPSTANLTNLEVAKVLTLIDPRNPLPEAVNVKLSSGEIVRILTSSPWMPPICKHCKGIGHNIKRCPTAPITCTVCSATGHDTQQCPRAKSAGGKKKSKVKGNGVPTSNEMDKGKVTELSCEPTEKLHLAKDVTYTTPEYNTQTKVITAGKSSETVGIDLQTEKSPITPTDIVVSDSSSANTPHSEDGEIKGYSFSEIDKTLGDDLGFVEVVSKRQLRSTRGRGPKPT